MVIAAVLVKCRMQRYASCHTNGAKKKLWVPLEDMSHRFQHEIADWVSKNLPTIGNYLMGTLHAVWISSFECVPYGYIDEMYP